MKKAIAKFVSCWIVFGFTALCLQRVQATNIVCSTTVDLSKATFSYQTNSGTVTESAAILVSGAQTNTLGPGDILSGTIQFANNESMIVTNTTGSQNDLVLADFEQV